MRHEQEPPLSGKMVTKPKGCQATQVAFDLDERFQYSIRKAALDTGVSLQIRYA